MLTGLTAQGASTRQPAPLFAVNIASQYAPGVAVMKTFGYTVPWRSTMLVTAGVSGRRRTPGWARGQPRRDLRRAVGVTPV